MATARLCTALLRRHLTQVVKTALLLFIVSFLWLQLRIVSYKPDFLYRNAKYGELDSAFFANFSAIINSVNHTMPSSLYELKKIIQEINKEQKVLNIQKFGPLLYKDVVIVVQVHNRGQYLYALIESLRQAEGIGQTLLIFSHDLFDPEINALIQQIDFCKVSIIYKFLYNIKLLMIISKFDDDIKLYSHALLQAFIHFILIKNHHRTNVTKTAKLNKALKKNCNNAKYPDLYGHYREAKFTQTKHHWWWKMNHVMDVLFITRNHSGPVLLLEEDHYVAPDFLVMLSLMEAEQKQ
ncbi:alpha-1,6-mannosyl-glycoprotein 2-beta-N-acetylglucosaminyltransferase-like [Centruroides sculpturatus]|uniref:alpha-1,6-mannosyl-glycoprotein 2-beta-N-acetylglucosaminyltransferase-like n=1 Tax=Centruroides sculpturatus TaxID=218467 RepID=UPI000C6E126E|nr:alpha-1,6-mannosyl-glycoprotein 2-beta-N-acetylglucosaminyltransferase-like [Centruroides sculpturatus]